MPAGYAPDGAPAWRYDDGGREAAGRRGNRASDCVVRAIAIAEQRAYSEVFDDLAARSLLYATTTRQGRRRHSTGKARRDSTSPNTGVWREVFHPYLLDRGWLWTPTMSIGSGTTVHARAADLPAGRLLLRLSRHLCAMVDGIILDTHDPSRDGTRCVYGYYHREDD